jgi:hypothetical protein
MAWLSSYIASPVMLTRPGLCRIKTNAMPLVLSGAHPAVRRIVPANVLPDIPEHVCRLRREAGFVDRLVAASSIARKVYPPAGHVEDQLYEGGFFPAKNDKDRFAAFHAAAAQEKFVIAQSMEDERARLLAERIIYNDWPRELPAVQYGLIHHARYTRYHQVNAPWMTIASALAEIAKLRNSLDPVGSVILDEYGSYLRLLDASDAA